VLYIIMKIAMVGGDFRVCVCVVCSIGTAYFRFFVDGPMQWWKMCREREGWGKMGVRSIELCVRTQRKLCIVFVDQPHIRMVETLPFLEGGMIYFIVIRSVAFSVQISKHPIPRRVGFLLFSGFSVYFDVI